MFLAVHERASGRWDGSVPGVAAKALAGQSGIWRARRGYCCVYGQGRDLHLPGVLA